MNNTTSATVESGENTDSKVTKFEMVMVCTLDRTKTGEQNPVCNVQKIRMLDEAPEKSEAVIPSEKESQAPTNENDRPGSNDIENNQTCPLPSKGMTASEKEAAMVDCMMKCDEKKEPEPTKTKDKFVPKGGKPIRKKKDTL
jgi:hypothetical protein